MPTGRTIEADWEAIKLAVCGGLTQKEACSKFGVPLDALKKRASRERWPTIKIVQKEAREILSKRQPVEVTKYDESLESLGSDLVGKIAETWIERGESHRALAFQLANGALRRVKTPPKLRGYVDKIRNWGRDYLARPETGHNSFFSTQTEAVKHILAVS